MSQLTRKRVRWLVGVALLLVPADLAIMTLLLAGGTTAASNWASGMTVSERRQAAAQIDRYPMEYRLELLKALTPTNRAETWHSAIDRYVAQHPHLTDSQRAAIGETRQLVRPEVFSGRLASEEERSVYSTTADRLVREIGKTDATVLLQTLGAPDTKMSALPWRVRLAQWLQEKEQALAAEDCNCSTESNWCVSGAHCGLPGECVFQGNWPACGAFYMYACNGLCIPG